jgi:hypothetical protein
MDMFEREATERDESLQLLGILSAWGAFKAVVLQLIGSYRNVSTEGQRYGAEIEEPTDQSIVIVCPRGPSPKEPLSSLMITIRAEIVRQGKFAIDCKIEQWRKTRGPAVLPHTEWKKSMVFVLDGDHASLTFAKETLTPAKAAEKLLEILLVRK